MHQLMLVTVSVTGSDILVSDDLTSEKVRQAVQGALEADRSFVGVRCDWFVIGGRWTGMLVGKEDEAPIEQMWLRYGADADALIVTPELYQAHLAAFAGKAETFGYDSMNFLDLDQEEVSPEFIGTKWLVVLDCHW